MEGNNARKRYCDRFGFGNEALRWLAWPIGSGSARRQGQAACAFKAFGDLGRRVAGDPAWSRRTRNGPLRQGGRGAYDGP